MTFRNEEEIVTMHRRDTQAKCRKISDVKSSDARNASASL